LLLINLVQLQTGVGDAIREFSGRFKNQWASSRWQEEFKKALIAAQESAATVQILLDACLEKKDADKVRRPIGWGT